ncbi:sorting nexin, putative [Ixodes scapularis]|uniref:Sorting nexin n=1 Tax=Ixodes scapularis TaxID=6945 RepID=B7P2L0_IXOSC|nr:sorting nexin, putative [Ixodes scapularis]|eukprot:XP_002402470.1 sorting nexin, putative [Ixodes scapularis]
MMTLQDGTDDSANITDGSLKVSLTGQSVADSLLVDISDALSERDKVKFTVHTKTTLADFQKPEFSVVRQHEEFIWLHDALEECENYAGRVLFLSWCQDCRCELVKKLDSPVSAHAKCVALLKRFVLSCREYLATFKKTVAMHELFLQRLALHPVFRADRNFHVFLEYDKELSVRGKNKKEKLAGLLTNIGKSADDLRLSSTQKDVDEFFEHERTFLVEYHTHIRDATAKSDKMTRAHKNVADSYIKISSCLTQLATVESSELEKFFPKVSESFEKARKIEGRVATDEDLKLSDTLRYYMRDTSAAKDLLYRRLRCLANYENANRALERARNKNKDVQAAEVLQQEACESFENISKQAKQELTDFKTRRVNNFRKNLIELAELELKHAKAQVQLLKSSIALVKGEPMKA